MNTQPENKEQFAVNDNRDAAARLRQFKVDTTDGTGQLRSHNGRPTLVGCTVNDLIGNAYVDDGEVIFEQSSAPIAIIDGRPTYLSESDVAVTFARRYADQMRFCHTRGTWFEWSGLHWKECKTGRALHLARELAHEFSAGQAKHKEIVATRRKSFSTGVEGFARVDPTFAVTIEDWDADKYLLGTPGGTVDLRTGKLRTADPADMITKITGVAPAETADCPRWLQFLNEATGNNEALIGFLKRWTGYCLTGGVNEHALIFVYGSGGNGKSVFVNIVVFVAGDYATTAAMDTFTESKNDKHPTDLAMLRGARLVTASETEDGHAWAEARVKQMTGGDRITARFMRQDFFQYDPEFKLLIVGNHLPRLNNVTDATRRRFNVVPFTVKPETVDKYLEQKLRDEAPGILRWAIEGCLEWQREGLGQPPAVMEATDEYFSEQDIFGKWLEECCRVERDNSSLFATTVELFKSWADFTNAAGEKPGTETAFGRRMTAAGFEKKRLLKRGFVGIELNAIPRREAN